MHSAHTSETTASLGTRNAKNTANANAPAACPLGNEKPPGDAMWTGAHQSSTSHGRPRANTSLSSETNPLVTSTHTHSQSASARVVFLNKKGSAGKSPYPPPTTVNPQKIPVIHGGTPKAVRRMASSTP